MNDRRFSGEIERLRAPERLARLEVERVVDLSIVEPVPTSMLDIGTGSAIFAEAFANKGLQVAGIDLREDMLEAAQQFVPDGDFRLAHMEILPFEDDAYDLVFMGLVLHEADYLERALTEAYRVARQRVMILEWPHEVGEFGPPLEHRLQPQSVLDTGHKVGFKGMQQIPLQHLTLFQMEKTRIL
ncbi:MAG: class I SAM-dependent methyltransferase [Anaerolineae bacterium]